MFRESWDGYLTGDGRTSMIQPFLNRDRPRCKPRSMQTRPVLTMMMVVMMVMMGMRVPIAMLQQRRSSLCIQKPVRIQRLAAADAHEDAAEQQHAGYAQRAETFNLAEAQREVLGRRAQRPGDCCESEDVGGQVGKRVPGVGDHGLRVEDVAAGALGDGHA